MGKVFKINLQTKTVLALTISLSFIAPTQAADFTIESGSEVTDPQFLNNANDVGVIEEGGELNTSAAAITASAINNRVTNKGSIYTLNDNAYGIYSFGNNATISNEGSISTKGRNGYGIYSAADDATISNQGRISTDGYEGMGINSAGNNAIISNSGSIFTDGPVANGIYSAGNNATISNQGIISTIGNSAYGIYSAGDNATISNQGTISTEEEYAYGIYSSGADATISNQGSITTARDFAHGIFSTGANATISNQGSISTQGFNASGISSDDKNATISNQGSISTIGDSTYGIYSFGNNATISNEGSISTAGEYAYGIFIRSDNATINNSGSISSSGPDSAAIKSSGLDAADTTLNLLPGSQIIGRIDLGNNDGPNKDTANIYGGSVSANLTFENTENINLFGAGVRSGNNVITVDTTGESTRGVALAIMTSSIHSVIGQRMAQTTPLKPVQLAALTLSQGMYFKEHKPSAWAQVFGGKFDRDAEGSALAYDYDHVGMNFGYEWDVNQHRVGLMGGVVSTDTQTQTSSFSSDSNNYYVGVYGNRKMNGFNITGSLLTGNGDHENNRLVVDNLNGFEVAKSDFNSFFVSPSLTIASAYTVDDRLELRPSANISYSMAWLDGYSEQGTTNSNLTIDDRKAKALTAKVQLAAAYALTTSSEFEFRVGMNARHTNDQETKVGIAGSQFTFANAGDESVTGGFAGASVRVVDENNLTLVADMEFGGNSDNDYATGSVSLEYVF
jgi:outer membrane autotransporter protein